MQLLSAFANQQLPMVAAAEAFYLNRGCERLQSDRYPFSPAQ